MKKMLKPVLAVVSVLCVTGAHAEAGSANPKPKELTRAVHQFLEDHGDLCLAMYTWPREVTPEDRKAGSNEALQMPVLERLGVVQSEEIGSPSSEPAKRYSLTAKGRQFFLQKKRVTLDLHSQPEVHDADFCVAHLTLDKVIKWSPPEPVRDHLQTVVEYTYHIKAAPFLSDEEARKVFPVVDRIVRGAGTLTMTATVQLQDGRWVPVLPGR